MWNRRAKWLALGGAGLVAVFLLPVVLLVAIVGGSASVATGQSCQPATDLGLTATASASAPTANSTSDPNWPYFEEAERQQETGSPAGDPSHDSGGCQGSYCWLNSGIWHSMAAEAGVNISAYPYAYSAPESVQDEVFTGVSWPVAQKAGGGQAGYAAAAAAWNGGTTAVVSNPGLGSGATNYTYANQVLAKMAKLLGKPVQTSSGGGTPTAGCTTSGAVATGSYGNPLRGVQNLVPERIDQGVDYGGTGPVYSLGDGKVLSTTNAGWPGGGFIVIQLSDGPDAGKSYYFAEDVDATVQVGQMVNANTQIGTMTGGSSGIETGWSDGGNGDSEAMKDHQAASSGDAGSVSTGCGQSFNQLLTALGAPPGHLQAGATVSTSCP